MCTKIRKKSMMCIVMLLSLLMAFTTLTAKTYKSAQAQTFEQRIPNYGLYCKDAEVVKSGMVKFDMTDSELLEQGTGVQKSEYQVTATNSNMEFVIPFISSAINCPTITVMVNEHRVEGSVWYGDGVFGTDNSFDIKKVYSPAMDDSITGTLYTVIPDNDIIDISLSFTERKSLIYETSNNFSSYLSEDGSHNFTLRNALSRPSYSFFVVGETTGHTFTSDCEYQMKILTCKEFVDVQYEKFKEYYEGCGGIEVEFLYSMVNKALSKKTSVRYDELFFSSIDTYRLNAFKFRIMLDIDSVISYEIPVRVQRNYAFEPLIYLVEHKQTVSCPIKFVMELNNEIPYIIETNKETESNGLIYTTETADDFYFVFSSSTNPLNAKTKSDNNAKRAVLIICIVVGGVALITEVAATCTEQGYTLYTCTECGDEKKDNYIEAKGHNYTESVVAATCTTAGYTLYSCADCGHTYTEQTESAKGHTFEVVVVPNTCTHKGYTTHFCTVCGYEFSDNYTDEIGHNYEEKEIAPTCTERGYTEHTCTVCGDIYFDNYVDALGHTYEAVITEPTCLEGGFTNYTCPTCGDSYIADYTELNGHTYTETVNAATCVTYGYTDHVCNDCGDRFVTDYVQPTGHHYLDVLVPATADSLGYTRHICVDCNYSYLSDFVTSGDDGYIVPPEEPVIPEIHQHTYEIQTQDDGENMCLLVMRVCACGDVKNGYFNVTFTDGDGNVTESKQTGNKIDYSELFGTVTITLADENGEQLKTVTVTAKEKPVEPTNPDTPENPDEPNVPDEPNEPENPDTPDEPSEPENPDEPKEPITPDEPNEPDKPNTEIENNGGNGVAVALFVILIVLAVGGVAGFIIFKKIKNKKNGGNK